MAATQAGVLRVLRNPRFRRLWLGQVVSAIGDYFYLLAVPILVNALTGSIAAMGLVMVVGFALPQLLFGIPAGVLVDRWERRRVMVAADLLRAGLVLGGLVVRDGQTLWVLYVVGFLVSAASRFFYPAQSALIPVLVSEDELLAANGLSQLTTTASFLVGPALAGFAIAWLGAGAAFVVDSASFVVSALAIWSIGEVAPPLARATSSSLLVALGRFWSDVRHGLQEMFGNATLRGILLSLSILQLGVGAVNVLWVPLLARRYGVGPDGLGLVDSMQGAGMAVGAVTVAWLSARVAKVRIVSAGLAVLGLMLALTGVAPSLAFILAYTFVLGLALSPVQAALATLAQGTAPEHLRGRVFGTMGTLGQVASLVSMGAAAGAAEWVGIPTVYGACGVLVALSGVVFEAFVREPKALEAQVRDGV